MDTTGSLRRIVAGALLSGGLAVAALGLASGTAQAFDPQPDPPGTERAFNPQPEPPVRQVTVGDPHVQLPGKTLISGQK